MNATVQTYGKRVRDALSMHKAKITAGIGSALLAAPAMAADFDLNATVGPLLTGVIELIPTIIDLIVAVVPAIIVLAVVGFIVGFLDSILKLLKMS